MSAGVCINPGIIAQHDGHCCLNPTIDNAPGYPPAPACHADEWREKYGLNHIEEPPC